jgi:cholesterol transport system auxiliary component
MNAHPAKTPCSASARVPLLSALTRPAQNTERQKKNRPPRCPRFLGRIILMARLMLLFCLAGCAALSPGSAPRIFQLRPTLPPALVSTPGAKNGQIIVALPTAARLLDSDHVALLFHGREIRRLADARWDSSVPRMTQRGLIDSLEASGAFRGVADESAGIIANLKLLSEVRAFWLRYENETAPPTAEVCLSAQLLNLADGKIVASQTFQTAAPANGPDAPALAAACETALSRVLADIAFWTSTHARGGK